MTKTRYVFDATPLIYLAKTGLLEATLDTCEAYTTNTILNETTGNTNYPDAITIKDSFEKGQIKIHSPGEAKINALMRHPEIHPGEAEVLASAEELGAYAIIDDKEARSVAELYDIRTRPGTLYILFRLVAAGKLGKMEAEEKLDQMVNMGLYLDPRTLIAAKNKLRKKPAQPTLSIPSANPSSTHNNSPPAR